MKVVGRRVVVVVVVVAMATVVVAVTRAVVAHRHRPLSHVVALQYPACQRVGCELVVHCSQK